MKKKVFTLLCVFVLLLTLGAAAHADGSVAIDEEHFPDEAFRRYVSETWDKDGNGVLSEDEIAAAQSIWLSANAASIQYHGLTQAQVDYIQANWQENIASLEGIEYFTNLRYLYAFMMTKLTGTVDLRQNTELRSIDMHCIEWINGEGVVKMSVTEVKVSGLQKLREISFTNQWAMASVDVSGCPALEKLSVTGTQVSTVDVSGNSNLKSLSCGFNPHINELDVSQNKAIEVLNVNGISVPFELTLGSLPNLRALSAQDSSIEELDISGCPILLAQLNDEYYHDEGTSHRYESVPGDNGYHLWYNKETSLITGENIPIVTAFFPDPYFRQYVSETWDKDDNGVLSEEEIAAAQSIRLSANAASIQYHGLTQAQVDYIQANWQENIASLEGIEYFTNLRYLYAFMMTKLTGTVDLRQNTELRSIDMHCIEWINGEGVVKMSVTEVKVSGLQKLREISFTNQWAMASVDVSGCPALEKLSVTGTQVSTVDVSGNNNLKSLSCGFNPHINELDVSQNKAIEVLNVNGISGPFELTLGNLPNLRALSAQDSSIEELDISGCPILLAQLNDEYYHDEGASHRYESVPGDNGYHLWYNKETSLITGENIPIVTAFFPDPYFRQYVSETWDKDDNGVLSTAEIAAVKSIDLTESENWQKNIESLEGIRYFTRLKNLKAPFMANLHEILDLSHNTALESVRINWKEEGAQRCLDGLILGELPNLTELVLQNQALLKGIDVSGCPALKNLNVNGIDLAELDVSNNLLLEELWCVYNPRLTELDVSKNTKLHSLNVHHDNGLTSLMLGNLPALRILTVQNTALPSLDISGCPILLGLLEHPEYYKDTEENQHLYESGPTNDDMRLRYNKATLLKTEAGQEFTVLTLPASLIRIEAEAFAGIAADIVILPQGCESVASRAFANCPGLKVIHVPAGTVLADDAFYGSANVYIARTGQ